MFTKKDFMFDHNCSVPCLKEMAVQLEETLHYLNLPFTKDYIGCKYKELFNEGFTSKIKMFDLIYQNNQNSNKYFTPEISCETFFTLQGWKGLYGSELTKIYDYYPAGKFGIIPNSAKQGIDGMLFNTKKIIDGKILVHPFEFKSNILTIDTKYLNEEEYIKSGEVLLTENKNKIEYRTPHEDTLIRKIQHTLLWVMHEINFLNGTKLIRLDEVAYSNTDTMEIIIGRMLDKMRTKNKSRHSITSRRFLDYNPIRYSNQDYEDDFDFLLKNINYN